MSRLLAIWIVLVGSRAFAQTPPAPPPAPAQAPVPAPQPAPAPPAPTETGGDVEGAKRHFEQAVALFNDGNFPAALTEFEQAYRLRPAAFVHYNIGLTLKALFRYSDAIVSLQRYLDESTALTPERRAEATQIINEMKALLADITLVVLPAGAAVTVDGRSMGVSPFSRPLSIAAGIHKLEVTADGHEPQKRDLIVTAGVPLRIELALKAISTTGKVRITSSVPRATVLIDGKAVGMAPLELELEAGGHRLEVSAPDHHVRRDELVIAAGQTRQVEVTLDRVIVEKKRWYKSWKVWTGVAVVVAGGTVGCGLAGCFDTQQGPIEGTLAPGAGSVR
ncbi:MAG: PEGA domain-containing protein [Deltaproteobacteria bacterium]|nr:PEGA domain-containing protein [Deltaproteobacteria bacterium]MDQ3295133.1 PEGA domain-containing protein [Myxococcota bacterium]